jgi:hypothetical protein
MGNLEPSAGEGPAIHGLLKYSLKDVDARNGCGHDVE